MKRKALIAVCGSMLLLAGCQTKLKAPETPVIVELGTELSDQAADYITVEKEELYQEMTVDVSGINTQEPGSYTAVVTYQKQSVEVPVEVKDSIAPVLAAAAQDLTFAVGAELQPEELVSVEELSAYTLVFVTGEAEAESLSVEAEGPQECVIRAADSSGNKSELTVAYTGYIPDTTAPEITAKDRSFSVGYELDYMKGVTAVDDVDGDITAQVTVDSSGVKKDQAGSYQAVYSVTDAAGNTATKEITVTVTEKKKAAANPNSKNAAANNAQAATPEASGGNASSSGSSSSGGNASGSGSPSGGSSSGGSTGGNTSSGSSSGSSSSNPSGGSAPSGDSSSSGNTGGNAPSGGDSPSGGSSDGGSSSGGGESIPDFVPPPPISGEEAGDNWGNNWGNDWENR